MNILGHILTDTNDTLALTLVTFIIMYIIFIIVKQVV